MKKRVPRPPGAALTPDTIATSVLILLLANLVQRSIGFARGVLFCRWLEPETLGHWEMAYGFLLLAAPVAVLGLPGSFGRYLSRFREQGRLRLFLRRTATWTLALAASAAAWMVLERETFATFVFGSVSDAGLMTLVAGVLLTVILHHFLEAVFAGMRLFRVVSVMHFCQSVMFALASLTLILTWRADAWSIVAGYGIGCVVSAMAVLVWSAAGLDGAPDSGDSLTHREFWPPLMRFAVWVWVTNLLSNLFAVVDRYMIVHCTGYDSVEAMRQVGFYHASALIPTLLVSVANLLVGALTPHFSHAWEQGRTREVSDQLNLTLKVTALGMLCGGVVVLALGPTLFRVALGGGYPEALEVMPWSLVNCVWFGLLLLSQTYAWVAEKSSRAAAPLVVGLAVNVALNLALLPLYGLRGALIATAFATLGSVATQLWANRQIGMAVDPRTVVLCVTPLALSGGLATGLAALAVALIGTCATGGLLTPDEKRVVLDSVAPRFGGGHSSPSASVVAS